MSNPVIPSDIGVSIGDVIDIGGVCYEVVSETTDARTHETVDSVHQSCEICQNASSAQEEESSAENLDVITCTYTGCLGCTTFPGATEYDTYQEAYDAAVSNCATECTPPESFCGDWCGTFIVNQLGGGKWQYTCCCQDFA